MARTIMVTGGTAVIGFAIAERFARDDRQVAIVARQVARLQQADECCQTWCTKVLATDIEVFFNNLGHVTGAVSAANMLGLVLGPTSAVCR